MKEIYIKWHKISLIKRIILGIFMGILLVLVAPEKASGIVILGDLFVGALKAIAPILVFFLVMVAVLQHKKGQKSNMKSIVVLYLLGTFLAAVVAVVGSFIFPVELILKATEGSIAPPENIYGVLKGLLMNLVDNPMNALLKGNYIGILFWSILFGGFLRDGKESTKQALIDISEVILKTVKTVIEFAHSVHFVTPQTLEDYPTFSFDNAFRIVEGGVVDKVTFKRINLRASKSLSEVADNSLSGKQVICPESDVFLINTIDFTNCYIENFRSIVRSKKATGNVGAIAFKECTINAIGNQGIVSTDGKNGNYINDVSFDECTITNICGIADLRNSSSGKSISITNTTFCYAPMENSFLFRVDPSIAVKIENCVFGGSMKIDGKLPKFNELGSGGQDDYTGVYPFSSVNSFQANDRTSSKGNLGLSDSKMSTTTLFTAPGTNNFKLNELFTGCSSVGASKWRR